MFQRQEEKDHIQSQFTAVPVPTFDGSDADAFLTEFEGWMRLTGVNEGSPQLKLDWLIQACTPKVKKLVEKVVEEHGELVGV